MSILVKNSNNLTRINAKCQLFNMLIIYIELIFCIIIQLKVYFNFMF